MIKKYQDGGTVKKNKSKGDLAPKARKVEYKNQAEADDISMINRTNSGDLNKLSMVKNNESEVSTSKKVASKPIKKITIAKK